MRGGGGELDPLTLPFVAFKEERGNLDPHPFPLPDKGKGTYTHSPYHFDHFYVHFP